MDASDPFLPAVRAAAAHARAADPDLPYAEEAFVFLHEGMMAAEEALRERGEAPRHLTGAELSEALRDHARRSYGLLAEYTLARWGLRTTRDFGEIVYILIAEGVFGKTEDDRIEDFDGVYDFREAFAWP